MASFEHLNKTGVLWIMTKIKSALAQKVDAVSGKGLTTNDLTDNLKLTYDTAATDVAAMKSAGVEANKIDTVSVNGTKVSPDSSKNVNISVPTSANIKSQIEAYGYQTKSQVSSAIAESLSGITGIDLQVVTALPSVGTKGVIYLIAHSHSDTGDKYDEFVWVASKNSYEKIGNTDVDLSAYVKTSEITDITETDLASMWDA